MNKNCLDISHEERKELQYKTPDESKFKETYRKLKKKRGKGKGPLYNLGNLGDHHLFDLLGRNP
jgi:hypothetical protein